MIKYCQKFVCLCVFSYLHLSEDRLEFLTNGVRSFLGRENILAHPHYVVRLFEGLHLVLGLELRAYAHWVSFSGPKIDAN